MSATHISESELDNIQHAIQTLENGDLPLVASLELVDGNGDDLGTVAKDDDGAFVFYPQGWDE